LRKKDAPHGKIDVLSKGGIREQTREEVVKINDPTKKFVKCVLDELRYFEKYEWISAIPDYIYLEVGLRLFEEFKKSVDLKSIPKQDFQKFQKLWNLLETLERKHKECPTSQQIRIIDEDKGTATVWNKKWISKWTEVITDFRFGFREITKTFKKFDVLIDAESQKSGGKRKLEL